MGMNEPGPDVADLFLLDPDVTFLNHGSFGACPKPVLAAQSAWRELLERQPLDFYMREFEPRLDHVRERLGAFIGADPAGIAFVPNATTAVNSVVTSSQFQAGDELLVLDHVYNACGNVLERAAARFGARVVRAPTPLSASSADELHAAVMSAVTDRTVFALLDHITSLSALKLPIQSLVADLEERGVATMIDGAHAPGQLPLNLDALGVRWYTGNCHKWLYTPKGAAFLYTRADERPNTIPAITSHAYNGLRADRSRYLAAFDWPGTWDPTAVLSIPTAMDVLDSFVAGGITGLMARNHELCVQAVSVVERATGLRAIGTPSLWGSMCAFEVPASRVADIPRRSPLLPPLQEELRHRHAIEVPVTAIPGDEATTLRFSVAAYNKLADYERLAEALGAVLTES